LSQIAVIGGVDQDPRLPVQRRDHQVHEAVVVEVGKSRPALIAYAQEVLPHFLGNVDKLLAALVFEHGVVLG
jgi:hypothetical protein